MITLDTSNLKENLTSSNLAEELWEKWKRKIYFIDKIYVKTANRDEHENIKEVNYFVMDKENAVSAISEAVERTKQACAEEFMASDVPELFLCLDDVLIFKKEIYETILQTKKG
ncbi:MAG: hypothetical protein NT007_09800 [Candidatus Kapabacteria bacterium]|nr:hypothetical protein [Candidatus Kapabacteria bacterium]